MSKTQGRHSNSSLDFHGVLALVVATFGAVCVIAQSGSLLDRTVDLGPRAPAVPAGATVMQATKTTVATAGTTAAESSPATPAPVLQSTGAAQGR